MARAFPDVPLLFNYAEGGKTPPVTHAFLRELGFKLVIFPIGALLAATGAIRSALARIKAAGSPIEVLPSMPPGSTSSSVHRAPRDPRARVIGSRRADRS